MDRISEISNELEAGWKSVLQAQLESKQVLEKDIQKERRIKSETLHLTKLKEEQERLFKLLQSGGDISQSEENGLQEQKETLDFSRSGVMQGIDEQFIQTNQSSNYSSFVNMAKVSGQTESLGFQQSIKKDEKTQNSAQEEENSFTQFQQNRTLVKTETFVKKNSEDSEFKFELKKEGTEGKAQASVPATPTKNPKSYSNVGGSEVIEGPNFKIKRRTDLATSKIIRSISPEIKNQPFSPSGKDGVFTSMVLEGSNLTLAKPALKPIMKFVNSPTSQQNSLENDFKEMKDSITPVNSERQRMDKNTPHKKSLGSIFQLKKYTNRKSTIEATENELLQPHKRPLSKLPSLHRESTNPIIDDILPSGDEQGLSQQSSSHFLKYPSHKDKITLSKVVSKVDLLYENGNGNSQNTNLQDFMTFKESHKTSPRGHIESSIQLESSKKLQSLVMEANEDSRMWKCVSSKLITPEKVTISPTESPPCSSVSKKLIKPQKKNNAKPKKFRNIKIEEAKHQNKPGLRLHLGFPNIPKDTNMNLNNHTNINNKIKEEKQLFLSKKKLNLTEKGLNPDEYTTEQSVEVQAYSNKNIKNIFRQIGGQAPGNHTTWYVKTPQKKPLRSQGQWTITGTDQEVNLLQISHEVKTKDQISCSRNTRPQYLSPNTCRTPRKSKILKREILQPLSTSRRSGFTPKASQRDVTTTWRRLDGTGPSKSERTPIRVITDAHNMKEAASLFSLAHKMEVRKTTPTKVYQNQNQKVSVNRLKRSKNTNFENVNVSIGKVKVKSRAKLLNSKRTVVTPNKGSWRDHKRVVSVNMPR